MGRWLLIAGFVFAAPAAAAAQDSTQAVPPPPLATLTLQDALTRAQANSPAYLQTTNDAGPARWGVRNAYASFLPTFDVSGGLGYTGSGQSNFGNGFVRATSPLVSSSYSLGLQWTMSGRVLSGPGQQKANQRATEENISAAGSTLRYNITTQYLTALQASAEVVAARQQVERTDLALRLARAKYNVGQATLIDVRQAEVQKGQAEVTLLRDVQAENDAKLELFRQIGVQPPVPVTRLALTDSFSVTPPAFDEDALITQAEQENPGLRALRAQQDAAGWNVRAAKSEYLPTLFAQAGWSGFTQQYTNESLLINQAYTGALGAAQDCDLQNQIRAGLTTPLPPLDCNTAFATSARQQLAPSLVSDIRSSNSAFPFSFESQPFRASVSVSLPIFTGFGRNLRVSQAQAQRDDAAQAVRAQELQVRTSVESRYLALQTSYQAIGVQAANRDAARDQLRLAQDRYRLGSGTSLELTDAQTAVQRAETDYISAVYDYHKAVAALEAAVGRPLR